MRLNEKKRKKQRKASKKIEVLRHFRLYLILGGFLGLTGRWQFRETSGAQPILD